MQRHVSLVLCIAALAAPAAGGCGGPSEEEQAAQARAEQRAEARREREAAERRAAAAAKACTAALGDFIDEITELDSRLDIGLSYDEYTVAVGDVNVAYNRSDYDDLSGTDGLACLDDVGVPAEKALNEYRAAVTVWRGCIEDYGCDIDSIDDELQRHWRKAARKVDAAHDALSSMDEPRS